MFGWSKNILQGFLGNSDPEQPEGASGREAARGGMMGKGWHMKPVLSFRLEEQDSVSNLSGMVHPSSSTLCSVGGYVSTWGSEGLFVMTVLQETYLG